MSLTIPMVRGEYLHMHARYFSPEFKNMYKLHDKIHNGYIYCMVKKRYVWTKISGNFRIQIVVIMLN